MKADKVYNYFEYPLRNLESELDKRTVGSVGKVFSDEIPYGPL